MNFMLIRNKECDAYMERLFGKPLFKKSFRCGGEMRVPLEKQKNLFRIEPLPASRR